jgi:hypothetical protein
MIDVDATRAGRPAHLLSLAADGAAEGPLDGVDDSALAEAIANRVLGEHTRVPDDALILVARHGGSS